MLTFSWLNSDGKLIFAARGVRAFGYGFLSVLLFIYLNIIGFNIFVDGVIISLILAGGAFFTILASIYADKLGRRKFLILTALLMTVSGLIYAFTTDLVLLIIGALIGSMSPSSGDAGSFQTVEQAIL
ncbi:MAG: MFS transporter, partial [Nitrososphaerales archaeon]